MGSPQNFCPHSHKALTIKLIFQISAYHKNRHAPPGKYWFFRVGNGLQLPSTNIDRVKGRRAAGGGQLNPQWIYSLFALMPCSAQWLYAALSLWITYFGKRLYIFCSPWDLVSVAARRQKHKHTNTRHENRNHNTQISKQNEKGKWLLSKPARALPLPILGR